MASAEPLIGLEVTSKKIRVVELVTLPTGIEVTNFATLELPQGGLKDAGPKLQSLLQGENFRGKKVNALLNYPSIDYLQVPLPPMSKANLSLAAAREAKKDLTLPVGELIHAHELVGESEEKGAQKKEVLIARANTKDVKEYLQVLKEADLRFNSITVIPSVLLNLFKMSGGLKEETLAGILVEEGKGTIVIFHQGNLRFPRDFPLKLTGEAGGLQVRLIAELKRSLLYLKQRVRGLEPQRIILLGDIDKPQEVTAALTQEAGIKTEMYLPPGLDLSPLGDRMEEFRNSLQQFILPLGLAWNGPERSELNLLAQEVQSQQRVHWAKIAVEAAAILFITLLILRFTWLWIDGRPHWKNITVLNADLSELQPKLQEMDRVNEDRRQQELKLALLGKIKGPKDGWAKILRTISLGIPPEMHLELLELRETPTDWRLKLKGQVTGANPSLTNKRFNEFFSLLLTSPDLGEVKIESDRTSSVMKGSASLSQREFAVVIRIK
ncbi:MAG TPA: type IV pilus biogenesis protein PilM [Candidatus Tripitaka sp. YC43]